MTTQTPVKPITSVELSVPIKIEHIVGASQSDSFDCPMARAMKSFLDINDVSVTKEQTKTPYQTFVHSQKLREEIESFDYTGAFTPGVYTVSVQ